MSAMCRTKGQAGERDVAALIRDATGWDVRQHDGDRDLEGVPGWSIEVRRHRSATRGDIARWWVQAVDQAARADAVPVLFFRLDRDAWRAVWPLAVALTQHQADEWRIYEWTAEATVEAWATVAREVGAGFETPCLSKRKAR